MSAVTFSFPFVTSSQSSTEYMSSCINYRPQRSWGKVIFSEACVKNSVRGGGGGVHGRGGMGGGCVCVCGRGGMHGRGACVAGGHSWQGGVWWGECVAGGVCGRGKSMAGGMHGRGACMAGGHAWQRVWMAGGGCMAGASVADTVRYGQ